VPLFVPLLEFSRTVHAEAQKVIFIQYRQCICGDLSKQEKRGKMAQNRT
jgi:hypothetical protein